MATKKSGMKKFAIAAVMTFAMLAGAVLTWQANGSETYDSGLRVDQVIVQKQDGGTHKFKLEIAETPTDIQIGLMFRKSMPKDSGMMFYFGGAENEVSFWMKNTLIPLDMLFVAGDGRIINLHRNAQPESLNGVPSGGPVAAVIELNGGRSDAVGITVGDRVVHPYFK